MKKNSNKKAISIKELQLNRDIACARCKSIVYISITLITLLNVISKVLDIVL